MYLRSCWAVALGMAVMGSLSAQEPMSLPDRAREVLRKHCAECHGYGEKVKGDLHILDPGRLKQLVQPGTPAASELLHMVRSGFMPLGTRPKVSPGEQQVLSDWIAGGAEAFTPEHSDAYALAVILRDVQGAAGDGTRDLSQERYISFNHLLNDPEAVEDLELYRAAFTMILNHLTWKEDMVTPTPIDPSQTIFRIRLDDLGWDTQPFLARPDKLGIIDTTSVDLFDLLLLEYPFASLYESSPTQTALNRDYLAVAQMIRPILFVRGDWFLHTAARSPLYLDLLEMPVLLKDLETQIGYKPSLSLPPRAALTDSKVVKNQRIIESLSFGKDQKQSYWRTYNVPSESSRKSLLDLVRSDVLPYGGEILFSLPNGLPGYYQVSADGHRSWGIPASGLHENLTSKAPLTVGLSCIRCHRSGLQEFRDQAHQALLAASLPEAERKRLLQRYPGADVLSKRIQAERERFELAARPYQLADGRDPLAPVSLRYESRLTKMLEAEGPLAESIILPRGPSSLTKKDLRDVLIEERLERAVRKASSGLVVLPVDGLTHPQRNGADRSTIDFRFHKYDPDPKTYTPDKARTKLAPKEDFVVYLKNTSKHEIHFELIGVDRAGGKFQAEQGKLAAGAEYIFPDPNADFRFLTVDKETAENWATVYFSDRPFPSGVLLTSVPDPDVPTEKKRIEGHVIDRIVHPLYRLNPNTHQIDPLVANFDPDRLSKQTIGFVTVVPPESK